METVILVVHLMIVTALVGLVQFVQRRGRAELLEQGFVPRLIVLPVDLEFGNRNRAGEFDHPGHALAERLQSGVGAI